MNNLEDIIQIALSAYDSVHRLQTSEQTSLFELHFRRRLMQASCVKNGYTYTINPPNLMGTWTTGGTITGPHKELLNG